MDSWAQFHIRREIPRAVISEQMRMLSLALPCTRPRAAVRQMSLQSRPTGSLHAGCNHRGGQVSSRQKCSTNFLASTRRSYFSKAKRIYDTRHRVVTSCDAGALESAASILSSNPLFQSYLSSLENDPLVTKCLTSAVVFTASDIIAQTTFDRNSQGGVDAARVGRFALFGLAVHAPLFAFFFQQLDALVDPLPLEGVANVGVKVAIDQVLWTPPFLAFFFFVQASVLQGRDFDQGVSKVREVLVPTLKVNWRVWVPANCINYLLPADLRILFINLVSLFFTIYLSTVANDETDDA
ncbi:hypothetical protein CYMTET_39221 [Cymbomonas tetramitiformis]|uniref:Uncharacterized protein n=1 Tax=Cymbomonas tetramitiformis TaxID=36881 RepID=A0AAE0CCS0_9CHLO|nr:hypothetical protein CYMTET_39223 [Cymbomonas tetramitiformis]KAK3251442.1 hypothetical protein CYMTET_39221 [Cymbomonas tetramitiformis]